MAINITIDVAGPEVAGSMDILYHLKEFVGPIKPFVISRLMSWRGTARCCEYFVLFGSAFNA
jgi:hypothetical protein